jgi:hypothetical protein
VLCCVCDVDVCVVCCDVSVYVACCDVSVYVVCCGVGVCCVVCVMWVWIENLLFDVADCAVQGDGQTRKQRPAQGEG